MEIQQEKKLSMRTISFWNGDPGMFLDMLLVILREFLFFGASSLGWCGKKKWSLEYRDFFSLLVGKKHDVGLIWLFGLIHM